MNRALFIVTTSGLLWALIVMAVLAVWFMTGSL